MKKINTNINVNKLFAIIVAASISVLTLTACKPGTNPSKNETNPETSMVQEESKGLSKLAPDPEAMFSDLEFEVVDPDVGDSYQFILKNADRNAYDEYVENCENGNFSVPHSELENSYQAYTEDHLHWISVSYFSGSDSADPYIYVSVKVVEQDGE